ncbi:hypothetical protein GGTG_10998 [Gaeumannomyces tritici R3-111a-1]|uniref:Uncharacterized protein n=1 Tax=Gaeumannomyces tritici (strain R3-111a-1) TaxID=644352 RepID=J3PBX4_GAET3|nr:hypothetical protein GGTG_10998 [Gaeumannomyces tritici R3-111a-1]EJT71744.1 hypothetical protein GGTG_10998 [Gaeumannomyces tritici R3-111a-1]
MSKLAEAVLMIMDGSFGSSKPRSHRVRNKHVPVAAAALGLAFLLVWPELLATRLSLAADRGMDSKRAWAYAGLALYAAGLLSLIVGIATPWSLLQPPGFDSFGSMDGGFAGLILRGPACLALFETLLAGLTLPYVRLRNLRGLARGNDVYPAVNGPALVQQPYSDENEEARQEGLGVAYQDRGSLGDIFAFQALEEARHEEGSGRA